MVRAVRAGTTVEATLNEATGPNSQVTGINGTVIPSTEVWSSRLIPAGWNMAVE